MILASLMIREMPEKAVCSAVGRGIPLPYPRRGKISPSSRLGFFLSYR
ncbi:hypothetical protein GCWU000342_01534 [Shuttleworthella satelles DSM 14600]|uniref:Uncharacterized protein n=1 Tax=Shuttleworthella satelles DSM 14600 TaxID=626523 RepID=C4GC47_9FIRM|nr:hypothetical protein GCWU000342_01534 [Shuttleworthia satelles DSM 14600]